MQRSLLERTGHGRELAQRPNFGRIPRAIGVGLIRLYQAGTKWKPATCRYTPSCSQYTLEAIEKYGLLKGIWMGTKRIFRCHPGRPGGHDPVP